MTSCRCNASTTHQIADDALNLLSVTHDHIGWLSALMVAIRTDAKHNNGYNLECLTRLGQHVADDWNSCLDGQTEDFRRQLDEQSSNVVRGAL